MRILQQTAIITLIVLTFILGVGFTTAFILAFINDSTFELNLGLQGVFLIGVSIFMFLYSSEKYP